jgi:hypothetical protein
MGCVVVRRLLRSLFDSRPFKPTSSAAPDAAAGSGRAIVEKVMTARQDGFSIASTLGGGTRAENAWSIGMVWRPSREHVNADISPCRSRTIRSDLERERTGILRSLKRDHSTHTGNSAPVSLKRATLDPSPPHCNRPQAYRMVNDSRLVVDNTHTGLMLAALILGTIIHFVVEYPW